VYYITGIILHVIIFYAVGISYNKIVYNIYAVLDSTLGSMMLHNNQII